MFVVSFHIILAELIHVEIILVSLSQEFWGGKKGLVHMKWMLLSKMIFFFNKIKINIVGFVGGMHSSLRQ